MHQRVGQNQKWPTRVHIGYITVHEDSKQGKTSEVPHKWAHSLHNPCHLGVPAA